MIKLLTIVGARPQFVKASAISRTINNSFEGIFSEIIVHTGQHFDSNMSSSFFEELDIPTPKYNLGISGGSHGYMTGKMIESLESVIISESPDIVLLYGDTNSTLAGAIAASKLNFPIAHVEAGLRSFNMKMPEEINRILTDRVSNLLFCPTKQSVSNLKTEGISNGVFFVGDVMYDVAKYFKGKKVADDIFINHKFQGIAKYALVTIHRAENTDYISKLEEILISLNEISKFIDVIFPIHPRTFAAIKKYKFDGYLDSIKVTEPLSFFEMIHLEKNATLILTDSGGVQKEALFYDVPCITIRTETEWTETIEIGANQLVEANSETIKNHALKVLNSNRKSWSEFSPYGDGNAAKQILNEVINFLNNSKYNNV